MLFQAMSCIFSARDSGGSLNFAADLPNLNAMTVNLFELPLLLGSHAAGSISHILR